MTLNNMNPIDRAAMVLSTGLILIGVVGLGIVEMIAGEPYGAMAVEVTNDAGEVVNTLSPAVDPTVRTGLVLAGLLVLLVWGSYKMAAPAGTAPARQSRGQDAT